VLRHSAAAALITSGASPKAVQVILGHRSVAFTLTVYGHLLDADLDDVATRLDEAIRERVADSVRTRADLALVSEVAGSP
jgi:integrase